MIRKGIIVGLSILAFAMALLCAIAHFAPQVTGGGSSKNKYYCHLRGGSFEVYRVKNTAFRNNKSIHRLSLPGLRLEFWKPPRGIYYYVRLDLRWPLLVFATYPAIAFIRGPLRRYRRRKRGWCIHCGYDLRGNVTGICSECGKPI